VSIAALLVSYSATGALAAGFALREQSAEGQGASFAGVAAGTEGLSSIFWNPATIALHDGFHSESNVSLVMPYSKADDGTAFPLVLPGSADSGNISVAEIVPASYYTYQLNDTIYLGLGINAPFGLETENRSSWVGAPHGTRSKIFSINLHPNIALKVTHELAIAVGLQAQYFEAKLRSGAPGSGAPLSSIKGDDIAVGFTAGILFQPTDRTQIGVGFRSSIDHTIDGDGSVVPLAFFGAIEAGLETPELVTIGLRHDFSDRFTFLAGVEWANWSRFKNLNVTSKATGATVAFVPQNWDDSWFFSLGGEYRVDERWTVRAGVAYEDSGVPDATRTPRLPDNDRYWVSVGASYKLLDWATANVGYSHVFMEDGDVSLPAAFGLPPLSASYDQHIDIVSASATFTW
jgi:long-chain fatty acid transport protein